MRATAGAGISKLWVGFGLVTVCLAMGCAASRGELEQIRTTLEQVSLRLSKIEESQQQLLANRPVAAPGRPSEDFSRVYAIEVGDAPIKGNAKAPVTLVAYSDFECPFCARTDPDIQALAAKYPDKLRIVFKHYPLGFHQKARPLAIASMAAQAQGRFWEFQDVVFKNQATLQATDEAIDRYAREAGLDLQRFDRDRKGNAQAYEQRIARDIAQGNLVDVRGTPTLYINGRKVQNRSVEGMSAMIDTSPPAK